MVARSDNYILIFANMVITKPSLGKLSEANYATLRLFFTLRFTFFI